ncbi:MAG: protein kinase [Phycisphaerales bacterium]|nr:MAG: protein kinase [Phycisphaerales bacterium]
MSLEAGAHLGPYEIVAPLGAGGMGEVYRAKDTRLDREVAVKVLPERLAKDADALARFEREAKAVAALSHPNILSIHDIGTEGETSYVVMELLEGETLRKRVRRSAIHWRKAAEYGAAIADGLAAAHAKGIIHRDLKPENIFLTKDGIVKILDFGLARMEPGFSVIPSEERANTPTVTLDTKPGTVLGTVNYMSPEQVRGQRVDARSDIFSFGSVLYEMMTGTRAFAGESTPETMTAILKEEPPSVIASCADAIPEVDRVITRCVEKKPELRIQSARDLGFALRDILMDSGPSKPTMVTPTSKIGILSWILVGVLAVGLAVILTLWETGKLGSEKGEAITSLAVLPFASAGGDPDTEYLSDEIPASIINNLARLSNLRVVPRGTAFRHKGQEKELATLGKELRAEAILTGRVAVLEDSLVIHAELNDVANDKQLWGTKYRRTLADILAIEEDIAEHISDALRLRLTFEDKARLTERYTENAEAYRVYLQGRFWWNKRAKEGFRKAIEFFDEAIRIDPTYALAYAGKASTYSIMGYYTHRPTEVAPLAREAAETAIRLDPTLAEAYPPLGWVHAMHDWDWEAAERDFRKAIELNPRYATAHHWYACFLAVLGRIEEGEREISRARELDPGSLIINREYATVAYFRRDFDLALARCHRAIEMDPTFAPAHKILGEIYVSLKRYDEAIAAFHRAVELQGRSPRYAGLLGWVYGLAGRRDEALEELRILNELSATGEYVPAAAFAMIYNGLGNSDLGFEWLDKACDERDNELPFYKFGPNTDALRGDPRFDALLRRMNLPLTPPAPDVASRLPIEATSAKIRLGVLPFEDMSPEPQEWFSDGMTGELITTLGKIKSIGVISRTSALAYKDTAKTLPQIAQELNVSKLVEGSVLRIGESVRISVTLIDAVTDMVLWSDSYERPERDVLTLQNKVARSIAEEIQVKLTPQETVRLTSAPTVNPAAYQACLLGQYHWNQFTPEGYAKAREYFELAIQEDPDYATAQVWLGNSYGVVGLYGTVAPKEALPKAKEVMLGALEIDDTLPVGHASLGMMRLFYDWDWDEAERELKLAIDLNPSEANSHHWYGLFLTAMGRHDEALAEAKLARSQDPLSAAVKHTVGRKHYFARQYDEAIKVIENTLESHDDFLVGHEDLAKAYLQKGMFEEAFVELARAGSRSWLGYGHALAGNRDEALAIIDVLNRQAEEEYVSPFRMAVIWAGLNEKDQAIAALEQAYVDRSGLLVWLNVEPAFDPLRNDPRFDDLLRRIGLEIEPSR